MKDLFKSLDGDTSSKRVGGIFLLLLLCGISVYVTAKHPEYIPDVLRAITWGIGVCFGATAMEKVNLPGSGK